MQKKIKIKKNKINDSLHKSHAGKQKTRILGESDCASGGEINSFCKGGIFRDRKLQGMNKMLSGICRADNTVSNPCSRVGKKMHFSKVLMGEGERITLSFLLSCLKPSLREGHVKQLIK